jgi:hypothetical protein
LAELDKNKDGLLTGDELNGLYVWQDLNSDAMVESGELKPVTECGIKSLSVKAINEPSGDLIDAHAPGGAVLADGKKLDIYDWWSKSKVFVGPENMIAQFFWEQKDIDSIKLPDDAQKLKMNPNGILSLYKVSGQLWLKIDVGTSFIFPARIEGSVLRWGDGSTVQNSLMVSGDKTVGVTMTRDGKYGTWEATVISGKSLQDILTDEHKLREEFEASQASNSAQ